MILSVDKQLQYFLSTIIAGLMVGLMFDFYRINRGYSCPKKLVTAISDILFWIFAALITFVFLQKTNEGILGYYSFVGIILGLFFYFKFISRYVIKLLRKTFYYVIKFIRVLIIIIFYPIKLMRYLLKELCFNIRQKTKKASSVTFKKLKQNKSEIKENPSKKNKSSKKIKKEKKKS
ncbi:spore cortex biosynthesis protein YabQ [Fervidicella metallireducens AeB]|uniref:Spore cortex biosynthesis protein YabQ n=1 Tax=Fervidicella metallireducens AeB TaxID=1403537 RepID=A0A017RVG6_9CLOT|nr:spore cortex biosynthesis protein YabQ [Fervidicella metallireducens]EYE87905.1 spore cortex biosynthesis protein YabQ [Fervidicella metallireducens AeB]